MEDGNVIAQLVTTKNLALLGGGLLFMAIAMLAVRWLCDCVRSICLLFEWVFGDDAQRDRADEHFSRIIAFWSFKRLLPINTVKKVAKALVHYSDPSEVDNEPGEPLDSSNSKVASDKVTEMLPKLKSESNSNLHLVQDSKPELFSMNEFNQASQDYIWSFKPKESNGE